MYFWTNTPNQVIFINYAAQVNELAAFIQNPNTLEEDAASYRASLALAKDNLASTFQVVQGDFLAWLTANGLGYPWIEDRGAIYIEEIDKPNSAFGISPKGTVILVNGEAYYWEDLYRMLILNAFLGRALPAMGEEKYDPREMYHVSH